MSNFDYIKDEFPEFYELAVNAESYIYKDSRAAAMYIRLTLEAAVKWLFANDPALSQPHNPKGLGAFVYEYSFKRLVPHDIQDGIHLAMKVGNDTAHEGRKPREYEVVTALKAAFTYIKWLAHFYGTSSRKNVKFDEGKIPKSVRYADEPSALPGKEKGEDVEGGRYADEPSALPGKDNEDEPPALPGKEKGEDVEGGRYADEPSALPGSVTLTKEDVNKLKDHIKGHYQEELRKALNKSDEEKEKLRKEIEALKAVNEKEPFEADFDPNEKKTRELYIDLLLREVGWGLEGVNDKEYKVKGMPVSKDNPHGNGYADYVLWGEDGKPLAVVEAKRTMRDAREGKQQAKLYADCLEKMHGQRPVIFYTNGFETYIWDDLMYPERPVYGFYTKEELETLIERRHIREDINAVETDTDIAGRPYQLRAIQKVMETFDSKQRKALLVMATGSGKTRTAVALVKRMTKANWVKRILFLADRRSLVSQAMKKSFNRYLPNLSMVNLLDDKESEETRMVFSTYQTMINVIDLKNDDETRVYGVGHFDLIIIDESHRSIYKKYGAIFDYFDAHLLGLTATPKEEIDKNTFSIFDMQDGHPTDAYDLKKAIEEGHLVGYKIKKPNLKFPDSGIRYDDLSPEEQEEYELTFTDEITGEMPEVIGGEAVNSWLFNKDTVRKVLEILMEDGIKVEGGDKLGKTIVFCRNQPHAEFVVEQFDKIWPQYKGHFCQTIHNKVKNPEAMIEDFGDINGDPVIAVSVDMLDTGIDVPEVVNLVFFKPVKSKSKFWQMIGRGTRLCPNLFGPGLDKDHFRIFDFCRNFEFFKVNSEGFESSMGESLVQRMFKARVRLAYYLQGEGYQEQEGTKELWQSIVDWLHEQICHIETDSALVRKHSKKLNQFREISELKNLSETKVNDLIKDLSQLPFPVMTEEEMKKRFDVKVLNLMLAIIENKPIQKKYIQEIRKTADDLLKKSSLPSVQKKIELLKRVKDKEFWKDISLDGVDKVRVELRELIKLLDKEDNSQQTYFTNFTDEVLNPDEMWEKGDDYGDEFIDYKESLKRYFNEHTELKSVWKLKNNVALTDNDLHELQEIIYSSEVSDKNKFLEHSDGRSIKAFVRSLTGMNREAVSKAFADYLNENSFNSKQIDCINIIIEHFVRYGFMDKQVLRRQPFSEYADGFIGLFGKDNALRLVKVIDEMNGDAG